MHDLFAAQTYHLGYQVHPSGWRLSDESDMSLVIKQKQKKNNDPKKRDEEKGGAPRMRSNLPAQLSISARPRKYPCLVWAGTARQEGSGATKLKSKTS